MRKSIVTVILLASAASAFAQTNTPSPTLAKAAKGPVAAKDAKSRRSAISASTWPAAIPA